MLRTTLLVLVSSLQFVGLGAIPPPFLQAQDMSPDMHITVKPQWPSVFLYEPVIVEVKLFNSGRDTIHTEAIARDSDYSCFLEVKRAAGTFGKWWPASRVAIDTIKPLPRGFVPGESLGYFDEICWQRNDPILDKAGKLEIRIDYRGRVGKLEGDCSVNVLEPERDDSECLKKLSDHQLLELIASPSCNSYIARHKFVSKDEDPKALQAEMDQACDIVRAHTASRYAVRVQASLVRIMRFSTTDQFPDLQLDRVRSREFISWCEAQMKTHPDARTLWELAHYYANSNPEKARSFLERTKKAVPDPIVEDRIKLLENELRDKR